MSGYVCMCAGFCILMSTIINTDLVRTIFPYGDLKTGPNVPKLDLFVFRPCWSSLEVRAG